MSKKPKLYIDIDGVLLANERHLAEGAEEFIAYIAENFDVYWLTTHCIDKDPAWAMEYVNRASANDLTPYLKKFRGTAWVYDKTEAIVFSEPFLWFDDDLFEGEQATLEENNARSSWVEVDLAKNPRQLLDELHKLQSNF